MASVMRRHTAAPFVIILRCKFIGADGALLEGLLVVALQHQWWRRAKYRSRVWAIIATWLQLWNSLRPGLSTGKDFPDLRLKPRLECVRDVRQNVWPLCDKDELWFRGESQDQETTFSF
jgi:hypothetical protein